MESDKGNIVQTGLVVGVEILAAVSLLAGGFGMLASLWFLGYSHMMDVLAGAAGLIAGSVLFAVGLSSLAFVGMQTNQPN